MPNIITVNINTPFNESHENSQIPDDYRIQDVIDELIDEWELPRSDAEGATIEYSLYSSAFEAPLTSSDKVGDVLRSGDTIRIGAESNGKVVEISPSQGGAIPSTVDDSLDVISVFLSVLDINRTEQVSLPTNVPVGELIKQIAGNYKLPPRDKQGDLIKYRLKSKTLGGGKEGFLLETMTLGQAGVPSLDTLTLHRRYDAGADAPVHCRANAERGL